MIGANVLLDSISPEGKRITTFVGTMHRWILPEFNTHRRFSRNSGSSRAIPFKKQVERIKTDLALPVEFAYNQAGMQAGEELSYEDSLRAYQIWSEAADAAVCTAERLAELNVHKQWVNRLLEPFMWHTVVFTSDPEGLDNFFSQRCRIFSPLAQPEMGEFADKVQEAFINSTPKLLDYGDWHTPFIHDEEYRDLSVATRIAVSVARCARVSYLTHDGVRDLQKDLDLYAKLVGATPPHESPLEHVATPASGWTPGNLEGWLQYRHALHSNSIVQELQDVIDGLAA